MIFSLKYKDIYFVGIILLAIALPTSMFLMSVSQFLLLGNWIMERNFKEKFQLFFKNKIALGLSSLFLLYLIGLIWTSNLTNGLAIVRIKLPLLILPLIFSGSPKLSQKQVYCILYFFIGALLIQSLISIYNFLQIDMVDNVNVRTLTLSISPIRLGLMYTMGILFIAKFVFEKDSPLPLSMYAKLALVALLIWFVFLMFVMQMMTGIILLCTTLFILSLFYIFYQKRVIAKTTMATIVIGLSVGSVLYVYQLYHQWFTPSKVEITSLETHTPYGNTYQHELTSEVENGNYVRTYVAIPEMREEWNKRSKLNFDSLDNKGQLLRLTLMRFLTSKGQRKDAVGVKSLNDEEIQAIENSIPNTLYLKSGFKSRMYTTLWEIHLLLNKGNPNAHTILQRIEYAKASVDLLKKHTFLGVGTGDIRDAFSHYYEETHSPLLLKWRNQSHNQYLLMGVGFGVVGMLWFVFVLLYPLTFKQIRINYFYLVFFSIISFSMLTEDTLETQAGITLFTFFQCLFLLCNPFTNSSRDASL